MTTQLVRPAHNPDGSSSMWPWLLGAAVVVGGVVYYQRTKAKEAKESDGDGSTPFSIDFDVYVPDSVGSDTATLHEGDLSVEAGQTTRVSLPSGHVDVSLSPTLLTDDDGNLEYYYLKVVNNLGGIYSVSGMDEDSLSNGYWLIQVTRPTDASPRYLSFVPGPGLTGGTPVTLRVTSEG